MMELPVTTRVVIFAARQHGIITTSDAPLVPTSASTLRTLARRGKLEQVSHGLYRLTSCPLTRLTKLMWLCRWAPISDWALEGPCALWLVLRADDDQSGWEGDDVVVEVSTETHYRPSSRRRLPKGLKILHRSTSDRHRVNGFYINAPSQLLADLAHDTARCEYNPTQWRSAAVHRARFAAAVRIFTKRGLIGEADYQFIYEQLELWRRYYYDRWVNPTAAHCS